VEEKKAEEELGRGRRKRKPAKAKMTPSEISKLLEDVPEDEKKELLAEIEADPEGRVITQVTLEEKADDDEEDTDRNLDEEDDAEVFDDVSFADDLLIKKGPAGADPHPEKGVLIHLE